MCGSIRQTNLYFREIRDRFKSVGALLVAMAPRSATVLRRPAAATVLRRPAAAAAAAAPPRTKKMQRIDLIYLSKQHKFANVSFMDLGRGTVEVGSFECSVRQFKPWSPKGRTFAIFAVLLQDPTDESGDIVVHKVIGKIGTITRSELRYKLERLKVDGHPTVQLEAMTDAK